MGARLDIELYCKTLEERLIDSQEQIKEMNLAMNQIWELVRNYETQPNLAIKILNILEKIE